MNSYPLLSFLIVLGPGLQKGTQPCDGFANNEVLHLKRAFITVKRFGVCEESSNVVIDRNAVAAEYLPGPRHSLPTLGRSKCLGEWPLEHQSASLGRPVVPCEPPNTDMQ